MIRRSFEEWLSTQVSENGLRTAMSGIYPDSYADGQYPPAYFNPISAVASLHFEMKKKAKKKPAAKKSTKKPVKKKVSSKPKPKKK